MNEKLSNKLTILNYILCIMIVCMHSINKEVFAIKEGPIFIFYLLVDAITAAAVPTFFFLSAMLFYRDLSYKNIILKLLRRIKSLVIPYIIWNFIFFAVYAILTRIPGVGDFLNMKIVCVGPYDIFHAIIYSDFTPLWFVRVLIIFSAISPVLLAMLVLMKKIFIIIPIIIFLICLKYNIFVPCLYYLPIYCVGAYLGYYHFNLLSDMKKSYIYLLFYVIMVFMVMVNWDCFIHIYRVTVPFMVIGIMKKINYENSTKWYFKISFFIYCTHMFFCEIIKVTYFKVIGGGWVNSLVCFLITPILTIFIISAISYFMQLKTPKIYSILTGSR